MFSTSVSAYRVLLPDDVSLLTLFGDLFCLAEGQAIGADAFSRQIITAAHIRQVHAPA